MPTYEYTCTSCGERTEVVQRFSDPPLSECPACGGTLKRVFHPVGIVLKGSGFYSTDNRASKRAAAKETTDAKETKTTESKPSESKPAESKPAESKPSGSSSKPSGAKPAKDSAAS